MTTVTTGGDKSLFRISDECLTNESLMKANVWIREVGS